MVKPKASKKAVKEAATVAAGPASGTATPTRKDSKKGGSTAKVSNSSTPAGSNSPCVQGTPTHEMVGVFKKESCCYICEEVAEKPSEMIKCRGPCQRSFHYLCLQIDPEQTNKEQWKCEECVSGNNSRASKIVCFRGCNPPVMGPTSSV